MKDGLKELQKKYEQKVTSQQPLESDAGGLGKTRASYEAKKKSAGDEPVGSQDENAGRQEKKARDKYRGEG